MLFHGCFYISLYKRIMAMKDEKLHFPRALFKRSCFENIYVHV